MSFLAVLRIQINGAQAFNAVIGNNRREVGNLGYRVDPEVPVFLTEKDRALEAIFGYPSV